VIAVAMLGVAAMLLCAAAAVEVVRSRSGDASGSPGEPALLASDGERLPLPLGALADRLGVEARLARAGLAERVSVPAVLVAKLAGAMAGLCVALPAAPAAPGRLSWIVAAGLPAAGFLGPDAWLERRARRRLAALRGGLPDALDLLAVGAAAGRSPLAGLAELGTGEGPLARELAVLTAESSCGAPQREALEALRARAPVREVAAMCGVIERSRRYGSPLAEQLHEQASSLRAVQRRRIEEHAARAAPKIQLAVALLLVPSVLLMIAAGLLANVDRFLAGL
jgi:tight adherence protein C